MANREGLQRNKRKVSPPVYPCADCFKECDKDVIECGDCRKWCHRTCEALTEEELVTLSRSKEIYLCRRCCQNDDGAFDFDQSLQRLTKVGNLYYYKS